MSKCVGCGSELNLIPGNEGYTKNLNNELCERCFRIRHYNEYKVVTKDNADYYHIIDSIGDDLTVLVIDLFDIPDDLNELLKHLNNNILLVLTKLDLMPSTYEEKFINYFKDNYYIDIVDSIVISSKKNYHLDELYDKIKIYNKSKKVYFVGYTNAGKSSIINKLIYNYSDDKTSITTSNLPSTTLSTIEIKLDDLLLIDTPGIVSDKSYINYIDETTLKKIIPDKMIKPIVYQIKTKQSIMIDDIMMINCLNNNNLVFNFSDKLSINRYYKNKELNNYHKHHINIDGNNDIVIPGVGFIKVMKSDEFDIYLNKNVHYYIRKSII